MSDDVSSRSGRPIPPPIRVLSFEPFRFDTSACRLYRNGVEVHLVPKAAAVLEKLLACRGETVSKETFFDTIWEGVHVADESLTQTISTIRQALGDAAHSPEYIQTVPGKGYRFIAPVCVASTIGNTEETPPIRPVTPSPDSIAGASSAGPSGLGGWRRALPWGVAALSLLIVAYIWLAAPLSNASIPARRVTRFTEGLPAGRVLDVGSEPARRWAVTANSLALSPFGRYLAYIGSDGGGPRQLYLRPLDEDDSVGRPIPGSEGALSPFFSPDGQWLGFAAGGSLFRVPVAGGLPQRICGAAASGASWGPHDAIAFNLGLWLGIGITSPAGGLQPQVVTAVDVGRRENGHRDPFFLPDGNAILYTNWRGGGRDVDEIAAVALDTGETTIVLERASGGRYVAPGYLTFVRAGQIQAQAFDAATLEVSGTPVAFYETERGLYDVSATGDLAYIRKRRERYGSDLAWVDRTGAETPLTRAEHIALQSSVSPDGKRVAVAQVEPTGEQDIWILDAVGKAAPIQVSFDGNSAIPEWSADGKSVIYNSDQRGAWETFRVLADGTGEPEVFIEGESAPYHWHPTLPHVVFGADADEDLWVLDVDANEGPRRLLAEEGKQGAAKFSPDGKWMLYTSNKEGEEEIFVRSYPDLATRIKVSQGGGGDARWAPDGREIYYVNGERMMAVPIDYAPELTPGVPRELFTLEERFLLPTGGSDYDVGPDGRFVMIKAVAEPVHTEIEVVLNWVEEIKKLIPPGGIPRGPSR